MASRIDNQTNGQSSREVYQEINRIRDDMDHTLEEIGGYLHPKHLLDYVVDSIRSGSPGSTKQTLRDFANQGASVVKRHPGPAMLLGGAVLWYLMEQQSDEDELNYRGPMDSRRRMKPAATYGAWEEGYDWTRSSEDENTWSERAKQILDQVRAVVADTKMAAKDKIRHVARHMVGASGKTREQLHAQWADLRAHSGSYIDARTGEPYDSSYGDFAWSQALACASLSDDDADDSTWSAKAQDALNSISESLKNTSSSVKEQFRSLGGQLSGLVSGGSDRMGGMLSAGRKGVSALASRSRSGMSRGWDATSGSLHSAADSARHGASRVTSAMGSGVRRGADQFHTALHQQPLAVGAACLGLGLLAGLLAPATRRENELMGDAADRLKDEIKDQVGEVGDQALDHGKEVVSAAVAAAKEEADRQGLTPENMAKAVMARSTGDRATSQSSGAAGSPQKSAGPSSSSDQNTPTSGNRGSSVSGQQSSTAKN